MRVYIVENRAAPVFAYQSWFDVGSSDEKLDPKLGATGFAHLFEHLMFRGTARFGDGEFDRIVTRNGAYDSNATTWYDRTNYYQSLPKEKLEMIVELESDRLMGLQLTPEVFEAERGAVLGELSICLDDPETVGYELLYQAAFQEHPYRYGTIGTEEEIKAFTLEDARYFYDAYYTPEMLSLLIVGDVEEANVLKLVQKYYGRFPKTQNKKPRSKRPYELGLKPKKPRVAFQHRQLFQPLLIVGFRVPEVTHPDQAPLWLAQALFTTGQGSILQRDWIDSGLASGVEGDLDHLRDPGLLSLAADLQPEGDPDVLIDRLERSIENLVSDSDGDFSERVDRARNLLLLSVYELWAECGTFASFMGEYLLASGHDPLSGLRLIEKVQTIPASEVARVIQTYLTKENRTIVIGHPEGDPEGKGCE